MASTSGSSAPASREVLEICLAGNQPGDELLRRSLAEEDGRAFFRIVVERLGDLFEPNLCDVYARLFSRVIEMIRPEYHAADLVARYERVRGVRSCTHDPQNVFVLSRVTLGADVAITSVILDGVKRRFPDAAIWFVGSRKNYELFEDDSRIAHLAWPYPRSGSLAERLSRFPQLPAADGIVVDTDSRLTQLGVVPVCEDDRYYFFESRAYGADGEDPLPLLASRWVNEVFGVRLARAYIAPVRAQMPFDVAVSFGVGENFEKRIEDPFEENLLGRLASAGLRVVLDQGGGGEESARAELLAQRVPSIGLFSGGYAAFASMISQARLYVGYDSAGQHVAAATGVPFVSVFAGYASERMFQRWRPHGRAGGSVIKVIDRTPEAVLQQTTSALSI